MDRTTPHVNAILAACMGFLNLVISRPNESDLLFNISIDSFEQREKQSISQVCHLRDLMRETTRKARMIKILLYQLSWWWPSPPRSGVSHTERRMSSLSTRIKVINNITTVLFALNLDMWERWHSWKRNQEYVEVPPSSALREKNQ